MGKKTNFLDDLEKEYDDYAFECECAIRNLLARLTNVQKQMERSKDGYNIFDSIEYRIKSFESTLGKLRRREMPMTIKSIHSLHDVAAVRIITPFRDDIWKAAESLKNQNSLKIVETKDYVNNPKENGYMGYHVIGEMKFHLYGNECTVPIEIQIRDKAMDLWASLEHIINYKNPEPTPEVVEHFRQIAEILNNFDGTTINLKKVAQVYPAIVDDQAHDESEENPNQ